MCEKGQGQGRRWIFGIGDRRDSHLSNHSRLYSHACMDIHTHFNGFHFVWPNMSHPRTHRIPLNGINELEANTLVGLRIRRSRYPENSIVVDFPDRQ